MSLKGLTFAKKEETRNKMLEFRKEAEAGNRATFKRMTKAERFKVGRQWDEDDVAFNESHGKITLTVNEVLPVILDVSGTQTSNPNDFTVKNVKGGTRKAAEILSSTAKNVIDKSDGEGEKSQTFEDGVSTARGFVGLAIKYDNDPLNGDFDFRKIDPFMVLPDPACTCYDYNEDKNGAKYIIVDDWIDKDKVKATYPGSKAELDSANFNIIGGSRFGAIMNFMFSGFRRFELKDDYRDSDALDPEEPQHTRKEKHNFRVSTYWWREYKKGVYVQRLDDPLSYLALTKAKDITDAKKIAETNDRIRVIEKDRNENPLVVAVLNMTVMVGDVLVDHVEDPFNGMNLFPIARYSPYFDNGYEMSIVENLIGPQKMLNFSVSSIANQLKQLANSGWLIDKGSQLQEEWIAEHGNEDGIVINKKNYGNAQKITPNPYDSGSDAQAQRMVQYMRDVSQVRLQERPGGGKESGKAKEIEELQGLKVQGVPFRNWKWTLTIIGRVLIGLIRNTEVFSKDEIRAIVEDEDLIDEDMLARARQIVIQTLQEAGETIPEPPNPQQISAEILQTAANEITLARKLGQETEIPTPEEQQMLVQAAILEDQALFQEFQAQVDQHAIPIAQGMMMEEIKNMQRGRYGIKIDVSPQSATEREKNANKTFILNRALLDGGQPGVGREQLIRGFDVKNAEEIIANPPQVVGAA